MKPSPTGALDDNRPVEEKAKDYTHAEMGFATIPNWVEKQFLKFFDLRNQDGSLTCGAQSGAKALGIENHKEEGSFQTFSALPIYDIRFNKPSGGMMITDIGKGCTQGSVFETSVKSQNLGETACNFPFYLSQSDKIVMEKYRAGGYVPNVPIEINTIASITDQGKGVVIAIFFQEDEWRQTMVVNNPNLQRENALRHFVVVTDYTLLDGKKYLVIEDSANLETSIEKKGQRLMTEEFFNKRCYGALYLLERPNTAPVKPKYAFLAPLTYGMRNNADVKALQSILKHESLMNLAIPSTGNYLDKTAEAVLKWQIKHNVASLEELNRLKGRRVGSKTITKLNELYK